MFLTRNIRTPIAKLPTGSPFLIHIFSVFRVAWLRERKKQPSPLGHDDRHSLFGRGLVLFFRVHWKYPLCEHCFFLNTSFVTQLNWQSRNTQRNCKFSWIKCFLHLACNTMLRVAQTNKALSMKSAALLTCDEYNFILELWSHGAFPHTVSSPALWANIYAPQLLESWVRDQTSSEHRRALLWQLFFCPTFEQISVWHWHSTALSGVYVWSCQAEPVIVQFLRLKVQLVKKSVCYPGNLPNMFLESYSIEMEESPCSAPMAIWANAPLICFYESPTALEGGFVKSARLPFIHFSIQSCEPFMNGEMIPGKLAWQSL